MRGVRTGSSVSLIRWRFVGLFLICLIGLPFATFAEQVSQNGAPPLAGPVIKADVRQVLVPVVVTDKKGHPVSGLSESDFTVFEDDVAQRVVAFSKTYDAALERSEASAISGSAVPQPTKGRTNGAGPESPLRTYLVCVDTLHSSFGNLVQARQALMKFFRSEEDGRAQYALMNLGRQIEVLQDSTRDPSLIFAALAGKKFQRSYLDNASSGIAFEADTLRKILRGELPAPAADLKHYVQMFRCC